MRKLIIGLIVGGLAVKLYRSSHARALVRDRLDRSPTALRQGAESLVASAPTRLHQVADMIDAAPVPMQMKDQASKATATIRSAAAKMDRTAEASAPAAEQAPTDLTAGSAPEDVLAEADAAARAASDARRELQTGA